MASYIKLDSHEEMLLKQIIFELLDSCEKSKEKAQKLVKSKKTKINTMEGTQTVINEINQEIEKIKEMMPEIGEKSKAKMVKKKKIILKQDYKAELKKIRERISSLG